MNRSILGGVLLVAVVATGCNMAATPATSPSPPPSPTVTSDVEAGQPTIYTVAFASGKTVETYIDPGSGTSLLHVTYFDALGNEMPISTMNGSVQSPDGTNAPLTLTLLEPGHFVASTTKEVGTYKLTASATAPDGEAIAFTLDLVVPQDQ